MKGKKRERKKEEKKREEQEVDRRERIKKEELREKREEGEENKKREEEREKRERERGMKKGKGIGREGREKRKREPMLTNCRTRGLVRFVQFAFLAEGHHNRRQDDDLIPRYEDGPRKRHERAALELKRHGSSAIDQDVEPDQSR